MVNNVFCVLFVETNKLETIIILYMSSKGARAASLVASFPH